MALSKEVLEARATFTANTNQEWARMPDIGQQLEGFYRTELFKLIKENKIKSAGIKAPGCAKVGMRLVHLPSLRSYIAKHAEQNTEAC